MYAVHENLVNQLNSFIEKHNTIIVTIRLSLHCPVCGNNWGIKIIDGGENLRESNFVCLKCLGVIGGRDEQ
jgi:hypothetical protein